MHAHWRETSGRGRGPQGRGAQYHDRGRPGQPSWNGQSGGQRNNRHSHQYRPPSFRGDEYPGLMTDAEFNAVNRLGNLIDGRRRIEKAINISLSFDERRSCVQKITQDSIFSRAAYKVSNACQEASDRLMSTMSRMDSLDGSVWRDHVHRTKLTQRIVRLIRANTGAELVTNAWAKMYELVDDFDLLGGAGASSVSSVDQNGKDQMKAPVCLHLCEAPGGFICATQHYYATKVATDSKSKGSTIDWTGVSLNPYYEGNDNHAMIDFDCFISHTISNWEFGEDNTGDIMSQSNIKRIRKRILDKGVGGAHLVTGDGAIDSSASPYEQEEVTAGIHFAELVCALMCVRQGGDCALKMFTHFHHVSQSISFLVSLAFKTAYICKPVMSTATNSETYLVGTGFLGLEPEIIDALLRHVGPSLPADKCCIHTNDMPEGWVQRHQQAAIAFADIQEAVLREAIDMLTGVMPRDLVDRKMKDMARRRAWVDWKFFKRYDVQRLDPSRLLAPRMGLMHGKSLNTGIFAQQFKAREGTLKERQQEFNDRKRVRENSEIDLKGSAKGESSDILGAISPPAKKRIRIEGAATGASLPIDQQGISEKYGVGSDLPAVSSESTHTQSHLKVEPACVVGGISFVTVPKTASSTTETPKGHATKAETSKETPMYELAMHHVEAALQRGGQRLGIGGDTSMSQTRYLLPVCHVFGDPSRLRTDAENPGFRTSESWFTLGKAFSEPSMSKFCRSATLLKVLEARMGKIWAAPDFTKVHSFLADALHSCELAEDPWPAAISSASKALVFGMQALPEVETCINRFFDISDVKFVQWAPDALLGKMDPPVLVSSQEYQVILSDVVPSLPSLRTAVSRETDAGNYFLPAIGRTSEPFESGYKAMTLLKTAQCLSDGSTLIVRLSDCFLRVTAGFLCILAECFVKTRVFTYCSDSGIVKFVVCSGFLGGDRIRAFLEEVGKGMLNGVAKAAESQQEYKHTGSATRLPECGASRILLECMPIAKLVHSKHLDTLQRMSEAALEAEAVAGSSCTPTT